MHGLPADQGERRFSEESVREIIQEAVALQQDRDDTYSEAQVRLLLAELGMSESITDEVIRHAVVSRLRHRHTASHMPVVDSGLLGVATGLATATALPFIPGSIILLPAMFGAGLMLSGVLVARNAPVSMARFQTANLALWGGMAGSFLLVTAAANSMLASSMVVAPWAFPAFWAFASLAGSVLSRYDGSARHSHRPGRIASGMTRVRSRVVGWIRSWASSLTVMSKGGEPLDTTSLALEIAGVARPSSTRAG